MPPKLLKSVSPGKQQYYLQQYFDEVLRRNVYDKNVKYNVIAFKNTYRNVPYYVVSNFYSTFSLRLRLAFLSFLSIARIANCNQMITSHDLDRSNEADLNSATISV